MKGHDLKKWRVANLMTQASLMTELGITSRQTLNKWESSERVPRIIELAVTAIDQIEACRLLVGYKTQFSNSEIANRRHNLWKQNNILEKTD